MRRLNLYWYFQAGIAIDSLKGLTPGDKLPDRILSLHWAGIYLAGILGGDLVPLRTSVDEGTRLLAAINGLVEKFKKTPDVTLEIADTLPITSGIESFEKVLESELKIADIYSVSPRGSIQHGILLTTLTKLLMKRSGNKSPLMR